MIESVLDCYIVAVDQKDPFFKRVKELDRFNKITLIFIISGIILPFACWHFESLEGLLIGCFIYSCVVIVLTTVAENIRRKNWDKNLVKYTDALGILKNILELPEFNLYEKNKLKQLIRKFNQSIKANESEEAYQSNRNSIFINTYIFPIIAFTGGRITSKFSDLDILVISLNCVLIIFLIKFLYDNLKEIINMIDGNRTEKKKYIVAKLQDLLDRDFEIKEEDLL